MAAYSGSRRNLRLFRAAWSAVVAAPLGALLRGLWLGSAVVPIFVLVMAIVTGGLIVLWRVVGDSRTTP
jgi:hypothetical protein